MGSSSPWACRTRCCRPRGSRSSRASSTLARRSSIACTRGTTSWSRRERGETKEYRRFPLCVFLGGRDLHHHSMVGGFGVPERTLLGGYVIVSRETGLAYCLAPTAELHRSGIGCILQRRQGKSDPQPPPGEGRGGVDARGIALVSGIIMENAHQHLLLFIIDSSCPSTDHFDIPPTQPSGFPHSSSNQVQLRTGPRHMKLQQKQTHDGISLPRR